MDLSLIKSRKPPLPFIETDTWKNMELLSSFTTNTNNWMYRCHSLGMCLENNVFCHSILKKENVRFPYIYIFHYYFTNKQWWWTHPRGECHWGRSEDSSLIVNVVYFCWLGLTRKILFQISFKWGRGWGGGGWSYLKIFQQIKNNKFNFWCY